MPKEVIMPKFGFTQETAEVLQWLVNEGDQVDAGDPIMEVSTDKVSMEVEAPISGILAGCRYKVGDVVRSLTEGNVGCDVAIECVGNEHALKACLDAVRKQGVVVQTGLHPHENPLDWFQVTFKDVDLRGSWAYPTHYWPRTIRLIASGALPAAKVITKRITLDTAVTEGFDALLDPAGTQLKILIDLTK